MPLPIDGSVPTLSDDRRTIGNPMYSLDTLSRAYRLKHQDARSGLDWKEYASKLKKGLANRTATGLSQADGSPDRNGRIPDLYATFFGHDVVSTRPNLEYSESVTDLIARIGVHPRLRHAARLKTRLEQLLDMSREEQPEQAPPALRSIKALVDFLVAHPELAQPSLVLTTEGHLRGRWRRSPQEYLALEFLDAEEVRFVVFTADPRHPYKTIRASGSATPASVMSLLEPYGVRRWTTEPSPEAQAE